MITLYGSTDNKNTMRKIILTIVFAILTTTLTAQIVEDNRERETITYVRYSNIFGMLHTIDNTYYLKYKDTKYSYIISLNDITIGDLESYRAFRKIVLESFNNPKGSRKRFSLNGVDFVVLTYSKKYIRIEIADRGISSAMGYWSIKRVNKLLPKI